MLCPQCQADNPPHGENCAHCGSPLPVEVSAAARLAAMQEAETRPLTRGPVSADPPADDTVSLGGALAARYEIVKLLGKGGMGAVYEARDLQLDRPVALKIIRPELARDPEMVQSFKQELILARQITHKNVIRIFDFGVADDLHFISMEYVQGKDLATLINEQGKLPPAEAARIMTQVCRGLAAAHAEGVVHCDLKPGNIMVEREGRVVVLDFGTARWLGGPGMQRAGRFSGTLQYMSPEQARGGAVDLRSDLFTAGAIFYQLLVGRLPKPPQPPRDLDPGIPQQLFDVVVKCLAPDPAARYQSAAEICRDLDRWSGHSELEDKAPAAEPTRRRWATLLFPAIAVAVIAGAILYRPFSKAPGLPGSPALTRLTGDSGLTEYPAFSPDGHVVVYASDRGGEGNLSLWSQNLVNGQTTRITRSPADDSEPAFSPDGRVIAFRSERDGGGIYVMPVDGGEPRLIAKHGRRPRFSPDGAWILYWVRDEIWSPSKIYVAPAQGGASRQLRPDFADAHYPVWSPDGKAVLFCGTRNPDRPDQEHDWWVAAFDSDRLEKTGAFEVFRRSSASQGSLTNFSGDIFGVPGQWIDGHILFSGRFGDSENLWRVAISDAKGKVTNAPQRLTSGATLELQPTAFRDRIAFAAMTANVHVWALDLERGRDNNSSKLQLLTAGAAFDSHSSLSADGKKLVFISDRSGNRDVWLKNLETGEESNLTATPDPEGYPRITWDGSAVAYRVIENRKQTVYLVSTTDRKKETICDDCGLPTSWSPDGRYLLFEPGSRIPAVSMLDVVTREKSDIAKDPARPLRGARISPDGRWIAFHAENGPVARTVYIAPFRPGAILEEKDWIAITDGTGVDHNPCWSLDGDVLYFLSERDGFRCIFGRRLDRGTGRPVGEPFAVSHFHTARRSLLRNVRANPSQVGLSAIPGRLVFTLDELAANIWMARIPEVRK